MGWSAAYVYMTWKIALISSECQVSWKVWMRVCNWFGVFTAMHKKPQENFIQFCAVWGSGLSLSRSLALIWIATVCAIWYHRNNSVFRGATVEVDRIFESIQFRSWLWLKAKVRGFSVSHYDWITNPIYCLNLVGE